MIRICAALLCFIAIVSGYFGFRMISAAEKGWQEGCNLNIACREGKRRLP